MSEKATQARVTYVWLWVPGLAMTDGAAARPASGLVVFALAVNILSFLAYTEARHVVGLAS